MPPVKDVSDAELAQLTDAEREALEEGETQDKEDIAALKEIADEGGDEEGDGKGDDDAGDDAGGEDETPEEKAAREKEEAAQAAAKAKREEELKAMSAEDRAKAEAEDKAKAEAAEKKAQEEAEAKAKADAESADADEAEILRPRLPRYEVNPVEKYEEKIKALDDEYAAVAAKFKAGEAELPELLATQRKVDSEKAELREQRLRAEMAADFNDKAGKAEWLGDVQEFIVRTKTSEGIDYNKPLLNGALDTALKTLAADDKNKDWSPGKFLREAHKMVKAELGLVGTKPKGDKPAGEKPTGEKPAGRKPALAVVKDIGKLPSAGDDDASGGNPEFAALDKLTGIDYEDALAAMPQKKQDAYLRQKAG